MTLFEQDKSSYLTPERINKLNSINFVWRVEKGVKSTRGAPTTTTKITTTSPVVVRQSKIDVTNNSNSNSNTAVNNIRGATTTTTTTTSQAVVHQSHHATNVFISNNPDNAKTNDRPRTLFNHNGFKRTNTGDNTGLFDVKTCSTSNDKGTGGGNGGDSNNTTVTENKEVESRFAIVPRRSIKKKVTSSLSSSVVLLAENCEGANIPSIPSSSSFQEHQYQENQRKYCQRQKKHQQLLLNKSTLLAPLSLSLSSASSLLSLFSCAQLVLFTVVIHHVQC